MKDYSIFEQKIQSLMEELQSLKEADEDEVEEVETVADVDVDTTADAPEEEIEETSDEEVVEDSPAEESSVEDTLLETIVGGLLRGLMAQLEDIDTLTDNGVDSKYSAVLAEVRENLNKAIGALQAVMADESEDARQQDEAREDAAAKIDDEEIEDKAEEISKEEVEVIKPIEGDEVEEVSEEEVEEVEDEEEKKESLKISKDKKLNEDLDIIISFHDYEPWSGAKDTYDYIMEQYGWDESAVESVLEEIFPDGCTDTELNDFFWFGEPEIYDIFGVKNPYDDESDDDDEDEDEEFEETEEVEVDENYDDISKDEIDDIDDFEVIESASKRVNHRR